MSRSRPSLTLSQFSMRFIVFIDLLGTLMLPSTVVYLIYLIIVAATGTGPFPLISIILIAAVYGLQVIVFLLKRQWQYIGWMLIYVHYSQGLDSDSC